MPLLTALDIQESIKKYNSFKNQLLHGRDLQPFQHMLEHSEFVGMAVVLVSDM